MIKLSEHASQPFDNELNQLFASLGDVKSHLHRFIALIQLALSEGRDFTHEAKTIDKSVNDLEFVIDQQVMRVISKYTPMMEELRLVLAVVKVGAACEHAADKLKNTVKRVAKLTPEKRDAHKQAFSLLLDRVAKQFDLALDHFSQLTEEEMITMLAERDAIHQTYKEAVRATPTGEERLGVVFIYRNLDRVAELAYDIAKVGFAARYNRKFVKPEL